MRRDCEFTIAYETAFNVWCYMHPRAAWSVFYFVWADLTSGDDLLARALGELAEGKTGPKQEKQLYWLTQLKQKKITPHAAWGWWIFIDLQLHNRTCLRPSCLANPVSEKGRNEREPQNDPNHNWSLLLDQLRRLNTGVSRWDFPSSSLFSRN